MTNEQKQVRDWMKAFGQECPEKPVVPSLEVRRLRAKLILEEALETIRALGFQPCLATSCNEDDEIHEDLFSFYDCQNPDLAKIADGCEDLKVVTEGTLVACGLLNNKWKLHSDSVINERQDNDPLFDEVMRSNWSKFWKTSELDMAIGYKFETTGNEDSLLVKDANGKVIKSPSYSPANLQPIIDEMSGKE